MDLMSILNDRVIGTVIGSIILVLLVILLIHFVLKIFRD